MSENRHFNVLIVGAGAVGSRVGVGLRRLGFAGIVGVVGEERESLSP